MSGQKTVENTQFGLVSLTGLRAPTMPIGTAGEGIEPLVDEDGRIWARLAEVGPPGFATREQDSAAALVASEVIHTGLAALALICGFNNDGATRYVQIYDLAAAPGPGDVPIQVIPVATLTEWSWSPDMWRFTNGIVFAISTTAMSFTSAGAVGFWNAQWWAP